MASPSKASGLLPLARIAGRVLDPVRAKRGFVAAGLVADWAEIAGPRYAGFTEPDKLTWPKGRSSGGVLTLRVEGVRALFVQHETAQLLERINAFLGFPAVAEIRIIQRPLTRKAAPRIDPLPLPPEAAEAIGRRVEGIESEALRNALTKLGEGILRSKLARP